MGNNTRIYNRFEFWSTDDCNCKFCVHYAGESRPCSREVCCIADIREEAARREQGSANGSQAREEAVSCPV